MPEFDTVLVANRGEIAVRVIRAAHDAGLRCVAVFAEPDRDALHVRLADKAQPLGGSTALDSYLVIEKILGAAKLSGANAIHPGYGFLSESANFAQAVLDAGLVWIGPDPQAIRDLGDKVTARQIAKRVNAPLVPGTSGAVSSSEEVLAFADMYGLPVAIKAAFGGGGRGLKVATSRDQIPTLLESATREALAAFGHGECLVERYLDRPRHVEAQVLADSHGTVIVAGTRDCSLQRRHQKLVEEAPAPFLSSEQRTSIYRSAKDICRAAAYTGAGTVEYLVGNDGTISFLEVNTRLQVEHPITEETTGIDLVLEQFRIARGEPLHYDRDPEPRGHAIEFRINGEDPSHDFLPAPGTLTELVLPAGPGVRIDSGVEPGTAIGDQFDSMLAKLVITGTDRVSAIRRSRRALNELVVGGIATALPFHRAVVNDAAFTTEHDFAVHTTWIESDFDAALLTADTNEPDDTVSILIGNVPLRVRMPGLCNLGATPNTIREKFLARAPGQRTPTISAPSVTTPMQGTVVELAVQEGQPVQTGDLIAVVEAMKMENPVAAHKPGVVTGLAVHTGAVLTQGSILCEITEQDVHDDCR